MVKHYRWRFGDGTWTNTTSHLDCIKAFARDPEKLVCMGRFTAQMQIGAGSTYPWWEAIILINLDGMGETEYV